MRFIKPLILIILIFNFCFGSCLSGNDYWEKSTVEIIGAEFGSGLLGGVVGAICGVGLTTLYYLALLQGNFDLDAAGNTVYLSGVICWTFGNAVGTYWTGSANNQGGRFFPTLAGAALGAVPSAIFFYHNSRHPEYLLYLALLSSVVTVISYNLSRRPITEGFSEVQILNRFDLPTFSFRTEKTKENRIIPVYDFRLINTRF